MTTPVTNHQSVPSLGVEHVMDGIQLRFQVLGVQVALLLHLLHGLREFGGHTKKKARQGRAGQGTVSIFDPNKTENTDEDGRKL